MGNCCTTRDSSDPNHGVKLEEPKAKPVTAADTPPSKPQTEAEIFAEEEKLFTGMAKLGLAELIRYLPEDRPMRVTLKNETWAEVPTCLGSLAAAKIAERIREAADLGAPDRQVVVTEKGIEKLVANLCSKKQDKRDSAAIALSHLVSDKTPEFHQPLLTSKAKEVFTSLLKDTKEGMRITISMILSSVFTNNINHKHSLLNYDESILVRTYIEAATSFDSLKNLALHLQNIREFYCEEDEPNDRLTNIVRNLGAVEKMQEVSAKLQSYKGDKAMVEDFVDTIIEELSVTSRATY